MNTQEQSSRETVIAEILHAIPEMARDSVVNNEIVLRNFLDRIPKDKSCYCLGKNTIQLVARHGALETDLVSFVAASDLYDQDPYSQAKTLGQVAYEAYAENREWEMPWMDRPPDVKNSWEVSAGAVLDYIARVSRNLPPPQEPQYNLTLRPAPAPEPPTQNTGVSPAPTPGKEVPGWEKSILDHTKTMLDRAIERNRSLRKDIEDLHSAVYDGKTRIAALVAEVKTAKEMLRRTIVDLNASEERRITAAEVLKVTPTP